MKWMHLDGVGTAESNENGLEGGSILNWENEYYREMGGLYYWRGVMECGYYGWGRVIWKWG